MNIKNFLDQVCVEWHPTGSRYICNPPVMDTDEDYICFIFEDDKLTKAGFDKTSSEGEEYEGLSEFTTWRYKHYNLVVTENREFFDLFVSATEKAKEKNILDKNERIKLFQEVLYGNDSDEIPL